MPTNRLLLEQQRYMRSAQMYPNQNLNYLNSNRENPTRFFAQVAPSNPLYPGPGRGPAPVFPQLGLAANTNFYPTSAEEGRVGHPSSNLVGAFAPAPAKPGLVRNPPSNLIGAFAPVSEEEKLMRHSPRNLMGAFAPASKETVYSAPPNNGFFNETRIYGEDRRFLENGNPFVGKLPPSGRHARKRYPQTPHTAFNMQPTQPQQPEWPMYATQTEQHQPQTLSDEYPTKNSGFNQLASVGLYESASEFGKKRKLDLFDPEPSKKLKSNDSSRRSRDASIQPRYVDDLRGFPSDYSISRLYESDPFTKVSPRKPKKQKVSGCLVINVIEPSIASGPRVHDHRVIDSSNHTQAYDQRTYSVQHATPPQALPMDSERQAARQSALKSAILQGACNTIPFALPAATAVGMVCTAANYLKSFLPVMGCLGVR